MTRRSSKVAEAGRRSPTHATDRDSHEESTRLAWGAFAAFLKEKGARVTRARQRVLEQVFNRHDHFRADDIAADLARGARRVSRGTVYRTLALLVEAGLVRELRGSQAHAHYEHVWGHAPHEHLVCDGCGSFIEFADPALATYIDRVCRERGFTRREHRLVICGTCEACRKVR